VICQRWWGGAAGAGMRYHLRVSELGDINWGDGNLVPEMWRGAENGLERAFFSSWKLLGVAYIK
jgi:hypothetical protein